MLQHLHHARRPAWLLSLLLTCAMAPALGATVANAGVPHDWCSVAAVGNVPPAALKLIERARLHLGDMPHPLLRMHTEGTLPHQGIYDESLNAAHDFTVMREAALAWGLSGEQGYADQVERFLQAWIATYTPSYNPIDETRLDAFIQSYTVTRTALSAPTVSAMQGFLRTLAINYIDRAENRRDASKPPRSLTWINNWQSHRIKLITMAAAALQDGPLLQQARRLFLTQLASNVRTDGAVEDFEDRDALHYVVYDLEPLTMAAIAAQPFDDSWLHARADNGATLGQALDWLRPFADGRQRHEEYVHSHVAFDDQRAKAGVPGFAGQWQPASAGGLFWQAARLDPGYRTLAQQLIVQAPDWLAFCAAP